MQNDEWILLKKPGTQITHTHRGVKDERELERFYSPIPFVLFKCNTLGCNYIDYFLLSDYLNDIVLECPICGGYNVSAEWIEKGIRLDQVYYKVIPSYSILDNFSNKYSIITATDQYSNYSSYNIFDKNTNTLWISESTNQIHEIIWKGSSAIRMDQFCIRAKTGSPYPATQGCPKDYDIYGSNNGVGWTLLLSVLDDPSSGGVYHQIPSPGTYLYYKIGNFVGDEYSVYEAFQGQYDSLTSPTTDPLFTFNNVENLADNNDNSLPWIGTHLETATHEVVFYSENAKKLEEFYITPGNVNNKIDPESDELLVIHCPTSYIIAGSNDGINYQLLSRVTKDPPIGNVTHTISTPNFFNYYKIAQFKSTGYDSFIDLNLADFSNIETKNDSITIDELPSDRKLLNKSRFNDDGYSSNMITNFNGTSSILYEFEEPQGLTDISLKIELSKYFESTECKSFVIRASNNNVDWIELGTYNNTISYSPFHANDDSSEYIYNTLNLTFTDTYKYFLIDEIRGGDRYTNFSTNYLQINSNYFDPKYPPRNAFSLRTDRIWKGQGTSNWVIWEGSGPFLLKHFYMRDLAHLFGIDSQEEVIISGSYDNVFWDELLQIDNIKDQEYDVNNTLYYNYYKIEINSTYTPIINHIRLMNDDLEYYPCSIVAIEMLGKKEIKSRVAIGELNLIGEVVKNDVLGIAEWEMLTETVIPEKTIEEFIPFTEEYYKYTYHQHLQVEED